MHKALHISKGLGEVLVSTHTPKIIQKQSQIHSLKTLRQRNEFLHENQSHLLLHFLDTNHEKTISQNHTKKVLDTFSLKVMSFSIKINHNCYYISQTQIKRKPFLCVLISINAMLIKLSGYSFYVSQRLLIYQLDKNYSFLAPITS